MSRQIVTHRLNWNKFTSKDACHLSQKKNLHTTLTSWCKISSSAFLRNKSMYRVCILDSNKIVIFKTKYGFVKRAQNSDLPQYLLRECRLMFFVRQPDFRLGLWSMFPPGNWTLPFLLCGMPDFHFVLFSSNRSVPNYFRSVLMPLGSVIYSQQDLHMMLLGSGMEPLVCKG